MIRQIVLALFLLICAGLPLSGQVKNRTQKASPTAPTSRKPITTQTAVTKDGRTVLLRSDGTWEYTNDPVVSPNESGGNELTTTALKALRLMAGATEVGISFEEYGRRLIDTKAEVDRALAELLAGDLKEELVACLTAYVDAGQAWNEMVIAQSRSTRSPYGRYSPPSEPNLYPDSNRFADDLQKKYNIPTETLDPAEGASEELRKTMSERLKPFRTMSRQVVLSTIWAAAKKHLEKAEELSR